MATTQILKRVAISGISAIVVLLFLSLLPFVDSTKEPIFDLTSKAADVAYWISWSGGRYGAPVVAVVLLLVLVVRTGFPPERRRAIILQVIFVPAICAGGGSALNEYGIKAMFRIPRPNIVQLAGENGTGPLGMTADEFYRIGNKEIRSTALGAVLESMPEPDRLPPRILAHWIRETGYSFPSGHAYSAMFFAIFFLCLALSNLSTKRAKLFYLLLPWAIAVAISRSLLGVHSSGDIVSGAILGLAIGLGAWVIVRRTEAER